MDVDNVDPSVTALTGAIGAKQGQPFTFNAAVGRYAGIRAIEVWAGPDRINGISVETTDNDSAFTGKKNGPSRRFEFLVGERLTSLSLWGNGEGGFLGAIKFRTSEKRDFDFGMTSWGRQKEYAMDVASGVMCGVFGTESDGIRCMGFLFYRRVTDSYATDFDFPQDGLDQIAMTPRSVFEEIAKNDTDAQQTVTLMGSYSVTESNTISYSGSVTVEGTFNIEFTSAMQKVKPTLDDRTLKKSGSVKISTTQGGTNAVGTSRTQTVQYTVPVVVPPRTAIRVEGTVFDLNANNVPFSANLHLVLDNGNKLIVPFKGYYNGVNSTQISVDFNKL